jgi:hypothetical protein
MQTSLTAEADFGERPVGAVVDLLPLMQSSPCNISYEHRKHTTMSNQLLRGPFITLYVLLFPSDINYSSMF